MYPNSYKPEYDKLQLQNSIGKCFVIHDELWQCKKFIGICTRCCDVLGLSIALIHLCLDDHHLDCICLEPATKQSRYLFSNAIQVSERAIEDGLDMAKIVQVHASHMQDRNTLFAIVQAAAPSDAGPSGIATKEDESGVSEREEGFEQVFQVRPLRSLS